MSKDTCIKANTYCPVHKGIVGADCWHDSKDFSVPRTDWKQVDEINTLREQVEKLTKEGIEYREKWLSEQSRNLSEEAEFEILSQQVVALEYLSVVDTAAIENLHEQLAAPPTPPASEDRKDAERFRWLKAQHDSNLSTWHVRNTGWGLAVDLDKEIDAAMQEGKK